MFVVSSLSLVLTLALFGLVQANPTATSKDKCPSNHFLFFNKCFPNGGPPHPPAPPHGKECPSEFYWHVGEGCCIPTHPNPPPKPTCPKSWGWEESSRCCKPVRIPPPPPPKPSPKPKGPGKGPPKSPGHYRNKRNVAQWDMTSCPSGLLSCSVFINGLITTDQECHDAYSDLYNCGACPGQGAEDCTKISNATWATCSGKCIVLECEYGFVPSFDQTRCIRQ